MRVVKKRSIWHITWGCWLLGGGWGWIWLSRQYGWWGHEGDLVVAALAGMVAFQTPTEEIAQPPAATPGKQFNPQSFGSFGGGSF